MQTYMCICLSYPKLSFKQQTQTKPPRKKKQEQTDRRLVEKGSEMCSF